MMSGVGGVREGHIHIKVAGDDDGGVKREVVREAVEEVNGV